MSHSYSLKTRLARAAGHTAMALAALAMVTSASAQERGERGGWRGGQVREGGPVSQGRIERTPDMQRPQAPAQAPDQARPPRVDNGGGFRGQRPEGQPNWRGQNEAAREAQREAYRNQGQARSVERRDGQPGRPEVRDRPAIERGQNQQGWRYGQRPDTPRVNGQDRRDDRQGDWRNRQDDRRPDRDRDNRVDNDRRGNEQWRNRGWQGDNRPGWQNGQRNDDWRNNNGRGNDGRNNGWRNDDRRGNGWQNGRDDRRWDRGWRSDNRYDWSSYRSRNRNVYRIGRYNAPYASYRYSRIGIGFTLGSLYYGQNYWVSDPWQYRLPEVYGPYRWVRYYNDVVLVDIYSGEVVDVIYDFFW